MSGNLTAQTIGRILGMNNAVATHGDFTPLIDYILRKFIVSAVDGQADYFLRGEFFVPANPEFFKGSIHVR